MILWLIVIMIQLTDSNEMNEEKFCMDANEFCDKLAGNFMLNVVYLQDLENKSWDNMPTLIPEYSF